MVAARGSTKELDSHHDADRHRTWSAVVRGPQYFNPYYNNTSFSMCVQNKGDRGPSRTIPRAHRREDRRSVAEKLAKQRKRTGA